MKQDDFRVLESLAASSEPLGFAALAEATGVPTATLTRQLARLVEFGYAEKVAHGSYQAGPRLIALGSLIVEHAAAPSFRPLLEELAQATGQNAELYALSAQGPVFLLSVPGRTEIRITMRPGYVVKSVSVHAAGLFGLARFGAEIPGLPDQLKARGLSQPAFRERVRQAERQRFFVERGQIRPELARAGVLTADGRYCVCVSGGVSEFPAAKDAHLRRAMSAALERFEAARGFRQSA